MAKQSFKTAVGAFVIGGLALLVAGIILLGGGRMFSDDIEYVLYFDGSVSGLNIGAPVVFRGVPMGQVTRISLEANPRDASVTIPVYIRLDENSIVRAGVTGELTDNFRQEILRRLIQRGLRARLQLQSLITGQYRVELDFLPNTPANFRSPMPDREIPTLPSPIDTLQRTVASLPLEEMAHTTAGILEKLNAALVCRARDADQSVANLAAHSSRPRRKTFSGYYSFFDINRKSGSYFLRKIPVPR